MAKLDPKDERIAELELQLKAANEATVKAESAGQRIVQLEAEIKRLTADLNELANRCKIVQDENDRLKMQQNPSASARVTGLDAAKAVELKVSSVVTNALNGARIDATAGSVLAEASVFEETQRKLGGGAVVYPVSADEIAAARKAGRAF